MKKHVFTGMVLVIGLLVGANSMAQQQRAWIAAKSAQYTIYYVAEYEQDVEFVRTWLDKAQELMRTKYELERHEFELSVYLYPEPAAGATTGTATLYTSGAQAEIRYLTPSAPDWAARPTWGTLGTPTDDYHAKILVHEYITLAQERITGKRGGVLLLLSPFLVRTRT